MTFPANWTRIRVFGKYLLRDGTVASGRVVFSSPQIVRANDTIVLPVDVIAELDGTGAIDLQLPATNDADVTPAGWAWTVHEQIAGQGRRFAIAVDANGGDIDLATMAPIVPPPLMGALAVYNLIVGAVTTLPAGSPATAQIRGAIPNQTIDLGIPQGAMGGGGSAFVFPQATPASTWTINHNLGYHPQCTLFDTGNSMFLGEIQHPSINQAVVQLVTPMAGSARLQ